MFPEWPEIEAPDHDASLLQVANPSSSFIRSGLLQAGGTSTLVKQKLEIIRPAPRTRIAIAIFLAMALLFVQWAGLNHRISHWALQQQLAAAPSNVDGGTPDKLHSCVAFDATTVADLIHMPPMAAPLITGVQVLAQWAAFASWQPPLLTCFSSRAPPLS